MFRLLLAALALAGLLAVGLQSMSRVTNCGGNTAALHQVREICMVAWYEMAEAPDRAFSFPTAPERARADLRPLARSHWTGKARYLVTRARLLGNQKSPPPLVAVCDRPFTNVPEHRFWEASPTHAAVYSDGTTRLLTTQEFAALPMADFVHLDALFPQKPDARAVAGEADNAP